MGFNTFFKSPFRTSIKFYCCTWKTSAGTDHLKPQRCAYQHVHTYIHTYVLHACLQIPTCTATCNLFGYSFQQVGIDHLPCVWHRWVEEQKLAPACPRGACSLAGETNIKRSHKRDSGAVFHCCRGSVAITHWFHPALPRTEEGFPPCLLNPSSHLEPPHLPF